MIIGLTRISQKISFPCSLILVIKTKVAVFAQIPCIIRLIFMRTLGCFILSTISMITKIAHPFCVMLFRSMLAINYFYDFFYFLVFLYHFFYFFYYFFYWMKLHLTFFSYCIFTFLYILDRVFCVFFRFIL